jgi:hypothetical protein
MNDPNEDPDILGQRSDPKMPIFGQLHEAQSSPFISIGRILEPPMPSSEKWAC